MSLLRIMLVVLQALYMQRYVRVLNNLYFTDHFYRLLPIIYFISNLACASVEPM